MQALVPEMTELVPIERCFAHPSGSHNGPAIQLAVTASALRCRLVFPSG
jgi:hypothetical protein